MVNKKILSLSGKICAGTMLAAALLLTLTISDYYIFNRFSQFGAVFCLSQWIKKGGLLLISSAVFFDNRKSADCARYIIPVAVILSLCTFGDFFDITKVSYTSADDIINSINLFMPKWAHIALFAAESAAMLGACAVLFIKYGFAVKAKSFTYLAAAVAAAVPLNIFENFFDINSIPQDSFLRFGNFTVWHFLAIAALAGLTVAVYYFLKNKPRDEQQRWLCAIAGVLLLQYHSKDSLVMGDGYNVYNNLFACLPLFICNIGVYISSLSVFLKKKCLYAISFFVHAGGAVSVFVYFGKPEMSDYGIFCSYSILYFCLTHCLLFILCVMPTALSIYKFRIKDCIVPLAYYFAVIVIASIVGALVTSYSIWLGLEGEDVFMPNYAFTQINPLPFTVPPLITVTLWKYDINIIYLLGLYAAYVAIFFTFYGCYRLFLFARAKILSYAEKKRLRVQPEALEEAAIAQSTAEESFERDDEQKSEHAEKVEGETLDECHKN